MKARVFHFLRFVFKSYWSTMWISRRAIPLFMSALSVWGFFLSCFYIFVSGTFGKFKLLPVYVLLSILWRFRRVHHFKGGMITMRRTRESYAPVVSKRYVKMIGSRVWDLISSSLKVPNTDLITFQEGVWFDKIVLRVNDICFCQSTGWTTNIGK